MMSSALWAELKQLAQQPLSLRQQFAADPKRAEKFQVNACGIHLDFAKNLITDGIWQKLLELAKQSQIQSKTQQMLNGDKINNTEQRAVWHMALRADTKTPLVLDGVDLQPEIQACHAQMAELIGQLHQGSYKGYQGDAITDLIWIGIGGSLLGPQMACEALAPFNQSPVRIHFAGNIDGAVVSDVVKTLNPATTLVFVASKSFGTEETKQNALAIRQWFTDNGADQAAIARHFWATSSNIKAAADFGIVPQHILPMWDWVGGRYSLWSAVGFPLRLAIRPQGDVAVTIYSELALVEDTRTLDLPAGTIKQEFRDVSAAIRPETVTLEGDAIEIVEQNFDYDLLTPAKLMEKAVGQTVTLVRTNPATGTESRVQAKVLAANGGLGGYSGDGGSETKAFLLRLEGALP